MSARLTHINVNPAGGVPKHGVPEAAVTAVNVSGDKQRNLQYHGGPTRAVCLYALERIRALRAEGHPIEPGSTGDNFTVEGLDWDRIVPGTRLRVGDHVLLEITDYTTPCQNIAGSFSDGQSKRISQKLHPGWSRVYAKVLAQGVVRTGDAVGVVESQNS